MKDFNEIMSHVLAIDKADDNKAISFYERKKNLEALATKVADELVAGRPVPVFDRAESVTRIDGMLPVLANELVSQHDMAIAHRRHLAERLEADGGENGAKAAEILRAMNTPADSKAALLRARGATFSEPGIAESLAADQRTKLDLVWAREQGVSLLAKHAANNAKRIEQAELRGFYEGRNQALKIVFAECGKWGLGDEGTVRSVLARVSEAICYMQKDG